MIKSAIISGCGLYRYELRRTWDAALPPMLMIMLNPSTADAERDDPTIRRCVRRAQAEGFGSLVVVNLGAFRATNPKDWMAAIDPVGPGGFKYLHQAMKEVSEREGKLVAAWGNHGAHRGLAAFLVAECAIAGFTLYCLGVTKSGAPRHPLYISRSQALMPFPMWESAE